MNIIRYLKVVLKSIADFFKDGGLMLAGSISYAFMMALVPFCLMLVAIFGYFLGHDQAFLTFFSAKLAGFFPSITFKITGELKKIISYRGLGTLTLALYGLLSFQLLSTVETAVNTIFKIRVSRHFLLSLARAFFIVTLVMAVIILSFAATSAIFALKLLTDIFPDIKVSLIARFFIGYLVPFMLVFLIVAIMYKFLPRKSVLPGIALAGSLFTTIMLEVAKHLFTLYVLKVVHLGSVYGSLSAFVIFLLWLYYSSCIFLIGAEVVHNLHGPDRSSK